MRLMQLQKNDEHDEHDDNDNYDADAKHNGPDELMRKLKMKK